MVDKGLTGYLAQAGVCLMKLLTMRNLAGLGLGVFFVSVIAYALPSQNTGAFAQGLTQNRVSRVMDQFAGVERPSIESLSRLLRVDERTYEVSFDPSISRDVLSSQTVRKIAFGNETLISVVSTTSGTYSTDGLVSPHVLYPGVDVMEVFPDPLETVLKILLDGRFVEAGTVTPLTD